MKIFRHYLYLPVSVINSLLNESVSLITNNSSPGTGHRTSNKCLSSVERFFLLFNFQFYKIFNKYSEVI